MITVIAEIKVKPGHRESVLQAIEKLIPSVLAEDGCGGYQPMIDHNAQLPWKQTVPDSIFMLEKWASLAHLEKHLEMEHMHRHRATIKDSVLGINIQVLEAAL
ncbi:putative quinol monooxygenase [Serratia odorifera]|jgi:quinol monooxygenase YgiN|uniref:Antibiotic biosynthesis monooxygenase n=2 Tax=Serratia odorifera TaxID=618 RepID=D4E0S9_SEROD|nr:putative quinol monooxygenase [Serratia odorifera]EFE96532.1 antibiotic biosynthesis monooxygenase [Serratia odorifera DSM 4582]MBJ2066771.1 antibiotic biosynthesis monooxygenase [Serratia odorifera]PNK90984.1 antibiotic biosynthesis monooxygenase [Serratia odorifera]RII72195.1 antibiotic biosynthesis monooxygenase [Serratia odorifera]VDZ57382.1 Probable quinol monooxygenase ygiN [Serratia odorifera]